MPSPGAILAWAFGLVATGHSVRADINERTRTLVGDELIPEPLDTLTHGITIHAPRTQVWPWLIQMGAGSRAGWYSYDFVDNGRQPSATRVIPELQEPSLGAVFPALPGITEGFVLLGYETRQSLVLGWPNPDGSPQVTWAFVLEERPDDSTRLIVRVRATKNYQFHGLPAWLSKPLIRVVHFLMQRKQLLGVARRAEGQT
jgi:hypothetical protein